MFKVGLLYLLWYVVTTLTRHDESAPNYKEIVQSCNLWRVSEDINDSWSSVTSIINFYAENKGHFAEAAGPGGFNDPDMIIIGDFGPSYAQQQVQMAMWAILAAPLFMSNDLRKIPLESKDLLLNKGAIRINQDPLGIEGQLVWKSGDVQIWQKPLTPKGDYAFALLNLREGGAASVVVVAGKTLGILDDSTYNVTNAFNGKFEGILKPNMSLNITVVPCGVFLGIASKIG